MQRRADFDEEGSMNHLFREKASPRAEAGTATLA
jgi:hypothetical protein